MTVKFHRIPKKPLMLYETPRNDDDRIVNLMYWLGAGAVIVLSVILMIATYICWHDSMPIWVREFLG